MDAELRDKISDLVEYIESLNDNRYYAKRRAKTLEEIGGLIQQEIAKAKEQERNKIIEYVQVNQKGQFEEDSTGSICWYLDDLVRTLKEHKEE